MSKKPKRALLEVYKKLYAHFGPQNWWPGDSPFEIAVGAILTQNTNWGNVEKAIGNIKKAKKLSFGHLYALPDKKIAELIRPAGYFNIKARRLRNFFEFLHKEYNGSMAALAKEEMPLVRDKLLAVNGIGPETADSILLYALGKEVFVIDAYTRRFMTRHKLIKGNEAYEELRSIFEKAFEDSKEKTAFFNEYHALIVMLGKNYCKPSPHCEKCPMK